MRDFIQEYLQYCRGTEVPIFYRRWCAIVGVAGILGRSAWVKFGASNIYPNVYCMLMGESGARKSTAIKDIARLLRKLGYPHIAPSKSSKEGFTVEMSEISLPPAPENSSSILEQNLFGPATEDMNPAEIFVAADEFNAFMGQGNLDFASHLGDWWDHEGIYRYKMKNSKEIAFKSATINILGGNTIENLMDCFPAQILSQGFFSRMIFVHSEKLNVKIHEPRAPLDEETEVVLKFAGRIKALCTGEFQITSEANDTLRLIYDTYLPLEDIRFKSYSNRRYTHLLKMCIIHAAARESTEISHEIVVLANTVLNYTEQFMPKALGEFGASRGSSTAHKLVRVIDDAAGIVTHKDLWKHVYQDLESMTTMFDILKNLIQADRIQSLKGGFLPNKTTVHGTYEGLVNYGLLTEEERNAKI